MRSGDGYREVGYGDVAVLCRASTSFECYENAFERAGLPFLTVAGRGFYGRPEVRDLLNTLAAIADPTNDLALFGALRSPVIGLSNTTLYRLRAEQRCRWPDQALWRALPMCQTDIPLDQVERLDSALNVIGDLHNQVGRRPVADILKEYLDTTDYRAALVRAGERRAARNASKLLSDAYVSGIVSVGEFLEYIGDLRESGSREGEARSTSEGAIQIMSVHAAKGLEFPIVVIADVTHARRSSDQMLLDPELGVLLPKRQDEEAHAAAYVMGKRTAEDKDAAEEGRLLYVAATRASEMLILSGCVGLNKQGALTSLRGWLGRIAGQECLGRCYCSPLERLGSVRGGGEQE